MYRIFDNFIENIEMIIKNGSILIKEITEIVNYETIESREYTFYVEEFKKTFGSGDITKYEENPLYINYITEIQQIFDAIKNSLKITVILLLKNYSS